MDPLLFANIAHRFSNSSYYYLSQNPNITPDIVQANPDKPWNYDALSIHPNITSDIVSENLDKPWNFNELAQKQEINQTINYVVK
jgi:hypothetical protein